MNITRFRINFQPPCGSLHHKRVDHLRSRAILFLLIASLFAIKACAAPLQEESVERKQSGSGVADCTTESGPVEKMICEDKKLQELHAELQDIYIQLQAIAEARVPIRKSQQSWLRTRNGCREKHCVEMAYRLRLSRMQMTLDICKVDKRWVSSIARPVEPCQRSLVGLDGGAPDVKALLKMPSEEELTGMASEPVKLERLPKPSSNLSLQPRTVSVSRAPDTPNPSFNCKGSLNTVERMICGDKKLADQDRKLTKLYGQLQDLPGDRQKLRQTQRNWLTKRNSCKHRICVDFAYARREDRLKRVKISGSLDPVWVLNAGEQISLCKDSLELLNHLPDNKFPLRGFPPKNLGEKFSAVPITAVESPEIYIDLYKDYWKKTILPETTDLVGKKREVSRMNDNIKALRTYLQNKQQFIWLSHFDADDDGKEEDSLLIDPCSHMADGYSKAWSDACKAKTLPFEEGRYLEKYAAVSNFGLPFIYNGKTVYYRWEYNRQRNIAYFYLGEVFDKTTEKNHPDVALSCKYSLQLL